MRKLLFICLFFAVLLSCAKTSGVSFTNVNDRFGTIVKRDGVGKTIYFIFSADSMFEGADTVLNVLDKRKIKGSFFFTGNCLRMQEHHDKINRIITDGHYVGAHSDKHILYADWDKNRTNLVSDDSLKLDLTANYEELAKFGIKKTDAPYYLPPYEWYNEQNVKVIKEWGIEAVNFTPGTCTFDDYTTPDMGNYRSSQELIDALMNYEQKNTLDGCIILIHPGTNPKRTDKLYHHLDELINLLSSKGYKFDKLK